MNADTSTLYLEMSQEEVYLQLPQDLKLCFKGASDELQTAVLTLLKYYHEPNKSQSVTKLFNILTKYMTGSDGESPSCAGSRGALEPIPADVGRESNTLDKLQSVITSPFNLLSAEKSPIKCYKHLNGETFGADKVLLKQVNVKKQLITESQNQWECDYIFLFCPIYFRVGADVEAAMTEWLDAKRVILVLMHHTHKASYSPSEKKWSDTYPNIILQVHVLFHETMQGLLDCEKNRNAIHQLQKFLINGQKHGFKPKADDR